MCVHVSVIVLFTSAFYSPRASFCRLTEYVPSFVGIMSQEASPIVRRKFRKMKHLPESAALTVAATIAHLKNEVETLKGNGINQYVEEGDAKVKKELKAIQLSYLSQRTEAEYIDTKGDDHVEANTALFDMVKEEHPEFTCDHTGAHHANLGTENSLNLFCNLVRSLKIGTTGSDGNPTVLLEKSTGEHAEKAAKLTGGFITAYESVATGTYSKVMQDRCVYGFTKGAKFASECTSAAGTLNAKVNNLMTKLFPDDVAQSEGVHVLFNWNAHSLFSYHTDVKSTVTVIVNLSAAKSSFFIAGKEEAIYNEPGDAFVLPSAAWHRSGIAERRTVKVAFFFNLVKKEKVVALTEAPAVSLPTPPALPLTPNPEQRKNLEQYVKDSELKAAEQALDEALDEVPMAPVKETGSGRMEIDADNGAENKATGDEIPEDEKATPSGSADDAAEPPVEETPVEEKGSGRMSNVQMFGTGGR